MENQSSSDGQVAWPHDIQQILDAFPSVFTVPDSLPPKRAYDHAIPLISGVTPVNIRAYRYPPQLKDEIDSQSVDNAGTRINSAQFIFILFSSVACAQERWFVVFLC